MTDRDLRTTLRTLATGALLVASCATGLAATAEGPSIGTRPVPAIFDLSMTPDEAARHNQEIRVAQGSCSAAAAQAAAQSGGQVLSVTTSQQGGQVVCIVTVLIPGRDGGRPRRTTITIPQ